MKKAILMVVSIFMLLALSACAAMSVDELYSLPKASEQYLQLEELTIKEKRAGFAFSAPLSGDYRQSILLSDLNNDGVDEALAFFRGTEQTLKICIYSRGGGDDYRLVSTIDGEGTAIRSIAFSDLDGDGNTEILVSWQISSDIRTLKLYSLRGWNASELLTVSECTEFRIADMDNDGQDGLLVLNFSSSAQGTLSMYKPSDDNEFIPSVAKLSPGIASVSRLRTGYIYEGKNAVFTEGTMEDGSVVTDIFIERDGELVNITADSETGISSARRSAEVYSRDIDKDNFLEVPYTVRLYNQSENNPGYQRYDWYSFDENGQRKLDVSTYHCNSDGWYILLPADWRENLTVRREDSVSGERTVVFSIHDPEDGSVTDILTIYKLTGDNRNDRAQLQNRFILLDDYTTIYAAKILYDGSGGIAPFTEDDVKGFFNLIYTEWNVGAL